MVIYPSKSGFDAWEKLGNPNWGWDGMTKYFRKFHTYHPPSDKIRKQLDLDHINDSLHGTDGPIQTSFGEDFYLPFNDAWPKVFENLGYKMTGDPITGVSTGAYTNQGVIHPKTRERSHAGNAYLNPEVQKRPNLRVLTETLVEKIILSPAAEGEKAVTADGIEAILKDGTRRSIMAKREVILAAGSVKTPQLLELSGIGDPDRLKSNGIEVSIHNANVGENLQEHGFVCCSWEVKDPMTSGDIMRRPEVAGTFMEMFQKGGSGPLGVCTIVNAYMPLTEEGGKAEIDKLIDQHVHEYKEFPGRDRQYSLLREILQNPDDGSGQYELAPFQLLPEKGPSPKGVFSMSDEGHFISIVSVLNHPFSRGSVHIKSNDAQEAPDLDLGFFEHPLDLELHARHTQWLETLARTEPMASLLKDGGRRLHTDAPAPLDLETAKQITKDRLTPHYHVTGTCAMMPKELGGVVDSSLKVYGTKNLRIVDASIFPLMPRGNIQSSVYAVAEKASDILSEARLAEATESLRI